MFFEREFGREGPTLGKYFLREIIAAPKSWQKFFSRTRIELKISYFWEKIHRKSAIFQQNSGEIQSKSLNNT